MFFEGNQSAFSFSSISRTQSVPPNRNFTLLILNSMPFSALMLHLILPRVQRHLPGLCQSPQSLPGPIHQHPGRSKLLQSKCDCDTCQLKMPMAPNCLQTKITDSLTLLVPPRSTFSQMVGLLFSQTPPALP